MVDAPTTPYLCSSHRRRHEEYSPQSFWTQAQGQDNEIESALHTNTRHDYNLWVWTSTIRRPDPFESEEQFEAVKDHIRNLAATNPERFAMISRPAAFRAAEFWLTQNFPHTQVVNSGCFPGDISTLGKDVRPEDTQFLVAMDPSNPRKFVAVNLVVFNIAYAISESGDALDTPEMKAAEQGLLQTLREWHKDGMEDGFIVLVSMGMDLTIYRFSGKDGLVDIPEGVDMVTKKVTPG